MKFLRVTFAFPYRFDQTPQFLLIHDFLHASLVSAGAAQ